MVSKMLLLCLMVTVVSAVPAAQPTAGSWGPGAALNPWLQWQTAGAGAGANSWLPPWLSGGTANPWTPSWNSGAGAGAVNPWIPAWASSRPSAGGAANPWIPAWASSGSGAANPWVSPSISASPWYPQWIPCATIGSDCLDCSTRVVCTKVGGIQRACSGTLPYCNLGQCSATPSAACAPNTGMSSADAEDEVV